MSTPQVTRAPREPAGPSAPAPAREPDELGTEPWERWSWLMGGIWLIFLFFPASALFTAGLFPWQVVLGLVLILTFAVITVWGYASLTRVQWGAPTRRVAARTLGLQLALLLLLALLIGAEALGVVPFMVAFSVFSLPWLGVAGVGVAALLAAVGIPLALGDVGLGVTFLVVTLFVAAATSVVRLIESRQEDHQQLAEELTIVRERERVARDVHDVLGHSLTVVTIKAELAERLLDTDVEASRRELAQIRSLTREALSEVRATVAGLRVARLSDELESARCALGDAGIDVEVAGELDTVDPRHRLVLAWILREAVTNVVRHSRATRCRIELQPGGLRVHDDGRGVDGASEGNGIRGARERLRDAGGSLAIATGPDGRGTTWAVSL